MRLKAQGRLASSPNAPGGRYPFEYFASCPRGLEGLLADELRALGISRIRPLSSGVAFFGDLGHGLLACLWSRVASRVLLILERVPAADADELYAGAKAIAWEQHIAADASFAIYANGTNDELRDSQFVGLRVKDAIADRIREACGRRPDVSRTRPDVNVNVSLRGKRASISIDLAGEALHRRGYRVQSPAVAAPLRESLAAALLLAAGWDKPLAAAGDALVGFLLDPLCGSGSIAIEAAMIAADRAPGLLRDYWGFTGWLGHDASLWQRILDEADERAEAGLKHLAGQPLAPVVASDSDQASIQVAFESAKKAGVERLIDFHLADVADFRLPAEYRQQRGLLSTNPPYGQRMSTAAQLPALYAALADLAKAHEGGFDASIITPDDLAEPYIDRAVGFAPTARIETMNGPLKATIRVWAYQEYVDKRRAEAPAADSGAAGAEALQAADAAAGADVAGGLDADQGAGATDDTAKRDAAARDSTPAASAPIAPAAPAQSDFANRLAKMARHRAKWARRTGVSCYRVYDADLPDYNVAIDVYQGAPESKDDGQRWLHIAEYRPPASIDPALAAARLAEVLSVSAQLLGVSPSQVFCKRRERSRGGSQYSQPAAASNKAVHLIAEGGLTFEVDLASRLDTGIFLDHRQTRALLREKAAGRDCLNLFAYTGTASAYMADGGATSVTSVDLSNTYIDWARRNLALNGFADKGKRGQPQLFFEQADVLSWVSEKRAQLADHAGRSGSRPGGAGDGSSQPPSRFGLVFVDVPTFSNSSRMGSRSWDVQRDHVELLIAVSRLLTRDGEAVFSTNLRSFKPDVEALAKAKVLIKDISAQTIPPDFERRSNIHRCYIVTRQA